MELEQVGIKRPDVANCGTCMMVEKRRDVFDYCVPQDSNRALGIQEDWTRVTQAHDPYLLESFVRDMPFHVDACLMLAESYKMRDQHESALEWTKRGIFSLECNFIGTFRPFGIHLSGGGEEQNNSGAASSSAQPGNSPNSGQQESNTPSSPYLNSNYLCRPQSLSKRGLQVLGRGMFLYMVCLQAQGLFNTALEMAKFIWKLSYYGGHNSLLCPAKKVDPKEDADGAENADSDDKTENAESDAKTKTILYDGLDPCHMMIHVLYLGIRSRKYDFVDAFCGMDWNTRESHLKYFDDPKFFCKSKFDVRDDNAGLPQWDGEKYTTEAQDAKDKAESKSANYNSAPSMASLYPPMAYTLALSGFYQATDHKELKKEQLAVTDICNWKCPGRTATEKFVKAVFLYPYLFKSLLEKNEIKLDGKPSGIRVANKSWSDLFNQIQDFGFQPEPHRGLSNLEGCYCERFSMLWKSDQILGWAHDSLCRLTAMFEHSSLFKGDWDAGIQEFTSYLGGTIILRSDK